MAGSSQTASGPQSTSFLVNTAEHAGSLLRGKKLYPREVAQQEHQLTQMPNVSLLCASSSEC